MFVLLAVSVAVLVVVIAAFIMNVRKTDSEETETPEQTLPKIVSYHSRKHGERHAYVLGRVNGHYRLQVEDHPVGVTVRRRPHLCKVLA